jgi:hypothetical protein
MRKKVGIAAFGLAALLTSGVLAASTTAGGAAGGVPAAGVDPAQFTNPKPNPYYPLEPGTVSRYEGSDEGQRLHERVKVTHKTKTILGVKTTVVRDVVRRVDGSVAEATFDWYAPDNEGNVWYFGEETATFNKHGKVKSREGSWQAGVDGAVAGLIMPADPGPTKSYRQEFYPGHAEDQAWIVQGHGTVKVPYRTVHDVVRSFEWTRLETDVMAVKFYGPGLGIVKEKDVVGGNEVFELVSVSHE